MTFVRNFLISFLIAFIVFAPLAYFGLNYVIDSVEAAGKPDSENNNTDVSSSDNQENIDTGAGSITMLMIARSDNPDYSQSADIETEGIETETAETEAAVTQSPDENLLPRLQKANPEKIVDFVTIVSVNTDSKKAVITAIPGNLKVEFKGVAMSLSDALYYADLPEYNVDKNYVADLFTSCTGIAIDCYTYVETSDFTRAADSLGKLTVDFPEAITIYDGATRFFPKGENTLSSADLKSLIGYGNYTNPLLKYQLISAMCKAILNQGCTSSGFSNFEQTWARISVYMDYDIGSYTTPRSAAEKLFEYRNCSPIIVNVIGQFTTSGDKNYFELDRTNTISQIKQYGF